MGRPRQEHAKSIRHRLLPTINVGDAVVLPYRRVAHHMEPLECKACGKELRPWSRCCDKPRIAVRIAGAFDTEGELISWADDEVEVAIEGVAIDYDPIKRTVEIRVGVTSENYDDGKLKPAGATTKSGKPAKAAWVQLKVLQARLRGPAGEESPDDG